MPVWQRRTRLALVVFMVLFGAGVYLAIRERDTPVDAAPVVKAHPDVVAEARGVQAVRLKGARQDALLEYGASRTFTDGRTRLFDVKVTVDQQAGRTFTINGREAEFTENQSRVAFEGDVKVTDSTGLQVSTPRATYQASTSEIDAPGHVEFAKPGLSGSADGARYDQARDVLTLLTNASVRFEPQDGGGDAVEIQSGRAELARRDNYMVFEGGAHLTRGGQAVDADTARAHLRPDGSHLDYVELKGSARITTAPGSGSLRAMSASDINLHYQPDGQTMKQAVLAGGSSLELDGASAGVLNTVRAEHIDIAFAPDGQGVERLAAQEQVRVDVPAPPPQPAREISAARLEVTGSGGVLRSARFVEDVTFREHRPKTPESPAVDRTVTARQLDLVLKSGFADVQQATFTGSVVIREPGLEAKAEHVRYDVVDGAVHLENPAGGSARPRVVDEDVAIEAATIELGLDGRRLTADGLVQSELRGAGANGAPAGRRLAMFVADQAVFVTAPHLEYDGRADRAAYTGGARLWQADTSIQADGITLDSGGGTLAASGSVKTAMMPAIGDERAGRRVSTVGTASELEYEDKARRITYREQAHLVGPQGDLRGARIEVYLAEGDGSRLERIEAYDTVEVQVEGRVATGDRLTYVAADERYTMAGRPVTLTRECLVTTGRTLTFYKSTDSITVDGREQRAQTTGVKCPEPPTR